MRSIDFIVSKNPVEWTRSLFTRYSIQTLVVDSMELIRTRKKYDNLNVVL